MMKHWRHVAGLFFLFHFSGTAADWLKESLTEIAQLPTVQAVYQQAKLPADVEISRQEAQQGFIEPLHNGGVVYGENGSPIFNGAKYLEFLNDESPKTVHPNLWHHAKQIAHQGLFQVTERIFQIRGLDLANITFIIGDTGLIIIDPLTTQETAHAGLNQFYDYLSRNPSVWRRWNHEQIDKPPVKAVIITHSHIDHFGGIWGVVTKEMVDQGEVDIYAPSGFYEHAVKENILFKENMMTRAGFMYGVHLPVGAFGQAGAGLGPVTSLGTPGVAKPTQTISTTGERRVIDGHTCVFEMASGTEAPSEMLIYFEEEEALCTAEVACPLLHNTYSIRGAQPRDTLKWGQAIKETQILFGKKAQVIFSPHLWPLWDMERLNYHLSMQSLVYQFIHDQTVRLASKGYDPSTIAHQIQLPEPLASYSGTQPFYGSLIQNVLGVYTYYLGHFDGNPRNLDPLTRKEQAKLMVEVAGGTDNLFACGEKKFAEGCFREASTILSHLVDFDPTCSCAKSLLAKSYLALGAISPNATWRNYYLTSALELKEGVEYLEQVTFDCTSMRESLPASELLMLLATRVDPNKASGKKQDVVLHFPDDNEHYSLHLSVAVLQITQLEDDPQDADIVKIDLKWFKKILHKELLVKDAVQQGLLKGSPKALGQLREILSVMDPGAATFPLTTSIEN